MLFTQGSLFRHIFTNNLVCTICTSATILTLISLIRYLHHRHLYRGRHQHPVDDMHCARTRGNVGNDDLGRDFSAGGVDEDVVA